jgi:serine/threonine protein kinase
MVADQMLTRVEFLHAKGVVHRDIKPENFVFGRGPRRNVLHLIDFGLSTRYCDSNTRSHVPYREHGAVVGTARYLSLNGHLGIEETRRDDLESVAYVLLFLLKGVLPWQRVNAPTAADKYAEIAKLKMATPLQTLCDGAPREFAVFLEQVRALRFDDEPDYPFYRRMFRNLFIERGFVFDDVYEWT